MIMYMQKALNMAAVFERTKFDLIHILWYRKSLHVLYNIYLFYFSIS